MSLTNPSGGGGIDPGSPGIVNTYVVDPKFARRFTAGWAGLLALFVIVSAPRVYRSLRTGRALQSFGFWEQVGGYRSITEKRATSNSPRAPSNLSRPIGALRALVHGPTLFSIPKTQVDVGEIFVIAIYYAILLVCLLVQSDLKSNSNRAGFLALAQLPAVFLFGVKNSPLSFLLARGYEKLNVLHRWSGRGIWLMATVHGSLWINQYRSQGLFSYLKTRKPTLGIAAYTLLCCMVLLSLRPVRQRYYQLFFITHVITFVSFFIVICYHTPYSRPWIYGPVALYAFDLASRLFRYRLKDAILESRDTQMTLIHIPHVTGGWLAGQHVHLRVFFGTRIYESHTFTIANAPAATSVLTEGIHPGGITLGARACGDWTRALNSLAQSGEKGRERVSVLVDGPYGGSTLDLSTCESVLLVAGGSGITFTLGLLDDLVGRVVKLGRAHGERTKRVDFVWYIRSFGAIFWFERNIVAIANAAKDSGLELRFKIFVTCLCDPESIPDIHNATVEMTKPSIGEMLSPLLDVTSGGGVGVAASGPESLTRSAQNTVARVGPVKAASVGGIELHTELFSM